MVGARVKRGGCGDITTVPPQQAKSVEELGELFSAVTDVMETAAATGNQQKGRGHVTQVLEGLRERMGVPASNGRKSDGEGGGVSGPWPLSLSQYVIMMVYCIDLFVFFVFVFFYIRCVDIVDLS